MADTPTSVRTQRRRERRQRMSESAADVTSHEQQNPQASGNVTAASASSSRQPGVRSEEVLDRSSSSTGGARRARRRDRRLDRSHTPDGQLATSHADTDSVLIASASPDTVERTAVDAATENAGERAGDLEQQQGASRQRPSRQRTETSDVMSKDASRRHRRRQRSRTSESTAQEHDNTTEPSLEQQENASIPSATSPLQASRQRTRARRIRSEVSSTADGASVQAAEQPASRLLEPQASSDAEADATRKPLDNAQPSMHDPGHSQSITATPSRRRRRERRAGPADDSKSFQLQDTAAAAALQAKGAGAEDVLQEQDETSFDAGAVPQSDLTRRQGGTHDSSNTAPADTTMKRPGSRHRRRMSDSELPLSQRLAAWRASYHTSAQPVTAAVYDAQRRLGTTDTGQEARQDDQHVTTPRKRVSFVATSSSPGLLGRGSASSSGSSSDNDTEVFERQDPDGSRNDSTEDAASPGKDDSTAPRFKRRDSWALFVSEDQHDTGDIDFFCKTMPFSSTEAVPPSFGQGDGDIAIATTTAQDDDATADGETAESQAPALLMADVGGATQDGMLLQPATVYISQPSTQTPADLESASAAAGNSNTRNDTSTAGFITFVGIGSGQGVLPNHPDSCRTKPSNTGEFRPPAPAVEDLVAETWRFRTHLPQMLAEGAHSGEENQTCTPTFDPVLSALPDPVMPGMFRLELETDIAADPDQHRRSGLNPPSDKSELLARRLQLAPLKLARSQAPFRLCVDVASVQFLLHPDQSLEETLARKLETLWLTYNSEGVSKTAIDEANRRLETRQAAALSFRRDQRAASLLDETLTRGERDKAITNTQHDAQALQLYRSVLSARLDRDVILQNRLSTLRSMLSTWAALKRTRAEQGYATTSISLKIKVVRESSSALLEEDRTSLERDVAEELNETLEVLRLQAKLTKSADDQETKPSEGDDSNINKQSGSSSEDAHAVTNEIDADAVRSQILRRLESCRRPLGQQVVEPVVLDAGTVSDDVSLPASERARRRKLARQRLRLRLVVDGEMHDTVTVASSERLTFIPRDMIEARVASMPRSASIILDVPSALAGFRRISEIYLPVPSATATINEAPNIDIAFSSPSLHCHSVDPETGATSVEFAHGVVTIATGWAKPHESASPPYGPATPAAEPEDSRQALRRLEALAGIGVAGLPRPQDARRWIMEAGIDPMDPSNARLMAMLQDATAYTVGATPNEQGTTCDVMRQLFSDNTEDAGAFVDQERAGITNQHVQRLVALELRFQEMDKTAPSIALVGPPSLPSGLSELASRRSTWFGEGLPRQSFMAGAGGDAALDLMAFNEPEAEEEDEMASILSAQHTALSQFLRDIRKKRAKIKRQTTELPRLRDVISTESMPDLSNLGKMIAQLFAPRRPLRPLRNTARLATADTVDSCTLIVRVVRAFELPVRTSTANRRFSEADPTLSAYDRRRQRREQHLDASATEATGTLLGLDAPLPLTATEAENVRPMVRATFRGQQQQTSVNYGPSAVFNEEFRFQFSPTGLTGNGSGGTYGGQTSASNQQCDDDVVSFDVYDRVESRSPGAVQHTNHWLGQVELPLETIIRKLHVDAVLRLESPSLLWGYTKRRVGLSSGDPAGHDESGRSDDAAADGTTMLVDPHISVFVTLQPPLQPPPPPARSLLSEEDPALLRYVESWQSKLSAKFPRRRFTVTCEDLLGLAVLVTRYLCPQAPPPHLVDLSSDASIHATMRRLCQFVASIPFVSDDSAFSGDVWATSDQFLAMQGGDEEEHALLLANMFLHLNVCDVYVAMGDGVPEGETAYVLTRLRSSNRSTMAGRWLLWNASTGQACAASDAFSPMRALYSVFNENNVWANVQKSTFPPNIVFDFDNSSHWKPLFGEQRFPIQRSVQVSNLHFGEVDEEAAQKLQQCLTARLRRSIEAWTPHQVTRWNRQAALMLKSLLNDLPNMRGGLVAADDADQAADLQAAIDVPGFSPAGCVLTVPMQRWSRLASILARTDPIMSSLSSATNTSSLEDTAEARLESSRVSRTYERAVAVQVAGLCQGIFVARVASIVLFPQSTM